MNRRLVHLVRHGEVHNPDHVVYADLDGYGLSSLGRDQAADAASHLAQRPVARIVSSPLQRAIETAGFIAARHRAGVVVDDRLYEWRLSLVWAGIAWDDLDTERPGQLGAYLADPTDLPFSPESLGEVSVRVAASVRDHADQVDGDIVVVSHQDPIHAAARVLAGRSFDDFWSDRPAHATVMSFDPSHEPWREVHRHDPPQGETFPPVDDSPAPAAEDGAG